MSETNQAILEQITIVSAFTPVDLSTGANTGDWVALANYGRVLVVLAAAAGAAGEPPTMTFNQATDTTGAGSKALTMTGPAYHKTAATDLTGTANFTAATITAASTFSPDTVGSKAKLWCVEIRASQLDVANGFKAVQLTVADVGATAQLGYAFYVLGEPRDPRAPEKMIGAI